jgi:probable phosphoglycerate mutase
VDIHRIAPHWVLFRDGCPRGETPEKVASRADRVVGRASRAGGNVALFAHGHILRVLAARWLELPPLFGARLLLDTSTVSVLGDYYGIAAIERWNAGVGK